MSVRQLTEVLDRSAGHRGAAALGVLLAAGPVATRSELEDLALELLDQAGIDAPRSTPELVLDGRRIRPDLLWRRQRLVVELDGGAWHDDKLTRENDGVRRRSSRRTATRVLRITWHQLVDDPRQTLARIRAALADAG